MAHDVVAVFLQRMIVPKERVDECLSAINALHSQPPNLPVDMAALEGGYWALQEGCEDWGFDVGTGSKGVYLLRFTPSKWYDYRYEPFFQTIAPFMMTGGRVTVFGEEWEQWRVAANLQACRRCHRTSFCPFAYGAQRRGMHIIKVDPSRSLAGQKWYDMLRVPYGWSTLVLHNLGA
jgi:hypothetical protein